MSVFFAPDDGLFDAISFLPAIHGGHEGGEGLVGLIDQFLAKIIAGLESGITPLGGFAQLGFNIHPMLIHFPIAFLFAYLVFDLFGLVMAAPATRKLGGHCLALGASTALLAVASGLYAAYTVPHDMETHQVMVWHQRAGYLIAALSSFLALSRGIFGLPKDRMALSFHQSLNLLLFLGLLAGADLGASLVYGRGVAVDFKDRSSATESPASF